MRSTEAVNAHLVGARTGSGDDDWTAPAAAGDDKYAGAAVGCLYEETRQRVLGASGPRTHVWRSLQVREELGVDWQIGDVVTFRPLDLPDALVGVVQSVEDPHTQPGEAGEVRLILDLR